MSQIAKASVIMVMLLTTGCWSTSSHSRTQTDRAMLESEYGRKAPGVVEYVWEEPMVDVVRVPPGLDPEGHYYRPAHEEVQEIRQGRWKYLPSADK
jgi:hypothetical protein